MTSRAAAPLLIAVLAAACEGGSAAPTTLPTPVATPTPAPAATPTPAPAPAPTPSSCEPPCEAPTTSTTPAARVGIRVYIVTDDNGQLVHLPTNAPVPVGYRLTIDATAKDAEGQETLGQGSMRWLIDDPAGAVEYGGNHTHQVKLHAKKPGEVTVQAKLDGVKSNVLKVIVER